MPPGLDAMGLHTAASVASYRLQTCTSATGDGLPPGWSMRNIWSQALKHLCRHVIMSRHSRDTCGRAERGGRGVRAQRDAAAAAERHGAHVRVARPRARRRPGRRAVRVARSGSRNDARPLAQPYSQNQGVLAAIWLCRARRPVGNGPCSVCLRDISRFLVISECRPSVLTHAGEEIRRGKAWGHLSHCGRRHGDGVT